MKRFSAFFFFVGIHSIFAATWQWKLVDSIAHPQTRFTQGLFWDGPELVESTGLVGRSAVYRMNKSGKVLDSAIIPAPHFGEGSARFGDDLLVLTWQSKKGFILDAKTLDAKGEFPIPGEGWGLATGDNCLWLSNGSPKILKLSPDTKEVVGGLDVTSAGKPVGNLNEIEVFGKYMLANIWFSDSVAVIGMADGKVVAWLDFSTLAKRTRKGSAGAEVLNGLAWDGKRLWLTGKLWSKIFAVEIKEPVKDSKP
jgi:glutamine cyclotransferase